MVKILTDSTADLPKEICDQYQISVIPMYIHLNGKMYRDGEDIQPEMLFQQVEKTGSYPTTSAPSPADFLDFFKRNSPAIYISVSSRLSATFRNAQLALENLDKNTVDVIDSRSISSGYGQVVIQAAEWRDSGLEIKELSSHIRRLINQATGVFILNSVDYIYHGGRCSAIEHFVASSLHIRPLLTVTREGTLKVIQKIHGSRGKAVDRLFDFFADQFSTHHIQRIFLTHLKCDSEVAYLLEKIHSLDNKLEVVEANVGCVLATHSGPEPLGFAYCKGGID